MLRANLHYFYTTIADGNMSTDKRFYDDSLTSSDIKKDFMLRRKIIGEREGFDGLKIITPIQKTKYSTLKNHGGRRSEVTNYPDGGYIKITKDMIQSFSDLQDFYLFSDIVMISPKVPKVAVAYPVADCPVLVAKDNKKQLAAVCYCGGEYVDRELPIQLIESLREEVDSKVKDISVYIGPHASKETFVDPNGFPEWVRNFNQVWSLGIITEYRGYYHIDIETAIRRQLEKAGVSKNMIFSSLIDSGADPEFYSNSKGFYDEKRKGYFYTGCFYDDKYENVKNKVKGYFLKK